MSGEDRQIKMTQEEKRENHAAIIDKGIKVTTLGVVGSGAATAAGEVMHIATGSILWGHMTGTMMALFHGAVALDVTFIGYRLYRMLQSQRKESENNRNLRLRELEIDALLEEIQRARSEGKGEQPSPA